MAWQLERSFFLRRVRSNFICIVSLLRPSNAKSASLVAPDVHVSRLCPMEKINRKFSRLHGQIKVVVSRLGRDIINQKLKWKITYDTASDTLRRKHFCIHVALLDMIWRHWNAIASHFSRRLDGFFSRLSVFVRAGSSRRESNGKKRSRRTISVQRVHLSLQIWYVQQHRERQARGAKKNVQETRIFNMKMTFYVFNDDRVVVIVRRTAAAAIVHRRRSIGERWAGVCEMWNW